MQARSLPVVASLVVLLLVAAGLALANGGPFVIKYPEGDPAAKGVLARLDPSLKPQAETRLRVVKEDLKVTFAPETIHGDARPPLASVMAAYTIENPTAEEIEVDFGFPILRGIYISPFAMTPAPDVSVELNREPLPCRVISNSAIYGIIRERTRREVDRGIARDAELARLIFAVRGAEGQERQQARAALASYLTGTKKWDPRDAALLVEYAGLNLGEAKGPVALAGWRWLTTEEMKHYSSANLGPLAAIGEQKATQFLEQLASRFDAKGAAGYEAVFAAWGGDVRERSVDLATGQVRPREVAVDRTGLVLAAPYTTDSVILATDPTVYARVDYLDKSHAITADEKDACTAVLGNLPVVFTFAPMNLLHYQVRFSANATQVLTVRYSQYPYADTKAPASYQLAYVVHPASLWKSFGPINLEVAVPEGVGFRASEACRQVRVDERSYGRINEGKGSFAVYQTALTRKTDELFLAVDRATWHKVFPQPEKVEADRGMVAPAPAPAARPGK